MSDSRPIHGIVPPYMLRKLAENPAYRLRALRTLEISERVRGRREATALLLPLPEPASRKRRTIFDAQRRRELPGRPVRGEGDRPSKADPAINEAYDYSGTTYDFFEQVFDRNSIDDHGLTLISTVHYDTDYDNAFWDGRQMVYGDGDGDIFERCGFTSSGQAASLEPP